MSLRSSRVRGGVSFADEVELAELSAKSKPSEEKEFGVASLLRSESNVLDHSASWRQNKQPDVESLDLRQLATIVAASNGFKVFIIVIVVVNCFMIALEASGDLKTILSPLFETMDIAFITVYTIEFIVKLYAEPRSYDKHLAEQNLAKDKEGEAGFYHIQTSIPSTKGYWGPIKYWRNGYNVFDFAVLLLCYVQVILLVWSRAATTHRGIFDYRRFFRALKAVRVLKVIGWFSSLQVIVNALLQTVKNIIHLMLLLVVMLFVFSFIGYYMFGFASLPVGYWGSFSRAIYTLVIYADGWTSVQEALDAQGAIGSRVFTIVFIFIGNFIFTNLFIAIVVQNLEEGLDEERKIKLQEKMAAAERKRRKTLERHQQEINSLMQQQGDINQNIDDILAQSDILQQEDCLPVSHLSSKPTWLETYLATLDHLENVMYCIQQLYFEVARTGRDVLERRLRRHLPEVF